MMKRIILTTLLLSITIASYGQVGIGDTYDKIKNNDSTGVLGVNPKGGGFNYQYENWLEQTKFIYIFDDKLNCHTTIIKPKNHKISKFWVKSLNKNKSWFKMNNKLWVMKRQDGMLVSCSQTKDDTNKTIFIFSKIN